jgi:hypothetical protein
VGNSVVCGIVPVVWGLIDVCVVLVLGVCRVRGVGAPAEAQCLVMWRRAGVVGMPTARGSMCACEAEVDGLECGDTVPVMCCVTAATDCPICVPGNTRGAWGLAVLTPADVCVVGGMGITGMDCGEGVSSMGADEQVVLTTISFVDCLYS